MHIRHGLALLAAIALLAMAPLAQASVLYGTTTSGPLAYDPFNVFSMISNGNNPSLGWVNSTAGIEFSLPGGTYQVESFTLPLRDPVSDVQATFTLYSGTTRPETALGSTTLNLPFSLNFALYTLTFPSLPALSGGQNYFLIGSVPQITSGFEQIDWAGSSPGSAVPMFYGQTWLTGTFASSGFLGWNTFTPSPGPAWQLSVASSDAPEPGLMLLTGAGLLALGVFRVRRS